MKGFVANNCIIIKLQGSSNEGLDLTETIVFAILQLISYKTTEANSVDSDQTAPMEQFDHSLHSL